MFFKRKFDIPPGTVQSNNRGASGSGPSAFWGECAEWVHCAQCLVEDTEAYSYTSCVCSRPAAKGNESESDTDAATPQSEKENQPTTQTPLWPTSHTQEAHGPSRLVCGNCLRARGHRLLSIRVPTRFNFRGFGSAPPGLSSSGKALHTRGRRRQRTLNPDSTPEAAGSGAPPHRPGQGSAERASSSPAGTADRTSGTSAQGGGPNSEAVPSSQPAGV